MKTLKWRQSLLSKDILSPNKELDQGFQITIPWSWVTQLKLSRRNVVGNEDMNRYKLRILKEVTRQLGGTEVP